MRTILKDTPKKEAERKDFRMPAIVCYCPYNYI